MDLKSTLNRHFAYLDLDPRVQVQLTSLLLLWRRSSGQKFVIKRLKMLKQSLISFLNFESDYLRHLDWYAKSKTMIKGPFRVLFDIDRTKRHQIRRSLSIVNTYYIFFTSEKDKPVMEREALDVIRQPYSGSYDYPSKFSPFVYNGKEILIEPNFAGLNTSKPLWGGRRSDSKWFDSIMETSIEDLPYQDFLDASSIKNTAFLTDSWDDVPNRHAGDLAFLHENGGKCRVICMPHAELQVVFQPFHKALVSILDNIKEDCTYDQESGALWASSELAKGKTLHSIDLKSATDRFPLWLQLKFLNQSGIPEEWLKAFKVTATSVFKTKHGVVEYRTGQPMGLYGSFPLLALGQHGLVRLAGFLNGVPTANQYRVLGDDILFSNDKLADAYRVLLRKYDIPTSESKCITGSTAEFCGFFITKDSINKGVKLKGDFGIPTALNYVKAIGYIPKTFPKNMAKLITPIVMSHPERGGLGLNPLGLSKEDREVFFDPLYSYEKWRDKKSKRLSSLSRFIKSQMFTNKKHLGSYEIMSLYLNKLDTVIRDTMDGKGLNFLPLNQVTQLAFLEDPAFIGIHTRPNDVSKVIKPSAGYIRKKFPYYFLT